MLCPAVRLLLGELWPSWEARDNRIGPEAIMTALQEVSDLDLPSLRESLQDMGQVAEAALGQKGQHSLFCEPLVARSVYERLRRISEMSGKESEQRKNALLRGLFLEATPLEGKYIARTAMRNMQAGIGHKTMIAALSSFLQCDREKIEMAYGLMPDLGKIAVMAQGEKLQEVTVQAKTPIRFMLFRQDDPVVPGCFLPRYPGLRVQVHKIKKKVLVFTSQLRDITTYLGGISCQLEKIGPDFIADALLIGFPDFAGKGKEICSQAEMLRYINRRHLSRKSRIRSFLLAYDLIALQGEDICSMPYLDRRARLLSILGEPQALPFQGISPAREHFLTNQTEVADLLTNTAGARALLERDLMAPYLPGRFAESDFIIRAGHRIAAMIVQFSWGRDRNGGSGKMVAGKYLVALRQENELLPVGWARRFLSEDDRISVSHALTSMAASELEVEGSTQALIPATVLLNLKIRGAHRRAGRYIIDQPVIEGFKLGASPEDADDLKRLEKISSK
jgi:DNA ligase-1